MRVFKSFIDESLSGIACRPFRLFGLVLAALAVLLVADISTVANLAKCFDKKGPGNKRT